MTAHSASDPDFDYIGGDCPCERVRVMGYGCDCVGGVVCTEYRTPEQQARLFRLRCRELAEALCAIQEQEPSDD